MFLTVSFPRLARRFAVAGAAALLFASSSAAFASDIPALMHTVEELRGRKFLHPVAQKTMKRAELREYLKKQMGKDLPVPVDRYLRILTALHLIDSKTSVDQLLDLYQEQVLAFYDPESHVFYSMDTPPEAVAGLGGAMDDAVIVHELTHALQDQLFNAGKELDSRSSDWDSQLAYQSVMEGEATLVMMAFAVRGLGGSIDDITADDTLLDSMATMANAGAGVPEGTPKYFVESMKYPYMEGLRFVTAAYRKGKWDSLDRVDRCPPQTTEEISNPADYWARVNGAAASAAHSQQSASVATTLGAFHWGFLLGDAATKGWQGDHVEFLENAAKTQTILVDTNWDSPANAAKFRSAYETMLKSAGEKPQFKAEGTRVRAGYGADAKAISAFLAKNTPAPVAPSIRCVK
jgi:hypothetical protein